MHRSPDSLEFVAEDAENETAPGPAQAERYEAEGGKGGGVVTGGKRSCIMAGMSITPVAVARMAATTMAASAKNATAATGRGESGTMSDAMELGVWFVIDILRKRGERHVDSVPKMNKL